MPRKSQDPRLVAALDRRERLCEQFERDFRRLKRVFGRLDQARKAIGRLDRRIRALQDQER